MSAPIPPLQATDGVTNTSRVRPTGAGGLACAPASPPTAAEPPVRLDTLPGSPPPEVLDEIAAAAKAYETLRAQGHEVRFSSDEQSGAAKVELRDSSGKTVRTLSAAEAIELAAGRPPEQG